MKLKKMDAFAVWITRTLLVLWSIIILYPLLWTLLSSLKSNSDLYMNIWGFPKALHFENYVTAYTRARIGTYFMNSVLVTVAMVVFSIAMTSIVSYVLARFRSKICKFLSFYFIFAMMIPGYTASIAVYLVMDGFHLVNSLSGLTIYYIGTSISFSTFILTGFFKTLPRELDESAEIDGCGYTNTFFKILLPLAKPGILTVVIFNFIGSWNEYFYALLLMSDETRFTLPLGLARLLSAFKWRTDWGAVFAGTVIVLIPSFLIYGLLQSKIEEGLTMGALIG